MSATPHADFGRVRVYFGEKNGKYPDGNQVVVRGADTLAAFDTPLVAERIGEALESAELVVLGHVHEDHMAGLHRLPTAKVYAHERDVEAARSWDGLAAHYGLSGSVKDAMHEKIRREFHYVARPDAIAYRDGDSWDLGRTRVRATHMPGHTAGHCVLVAEPDGVAFIGDIDLSGFGPYYGDASSDLGAFRRSLARLPELEAKVWITSHHRGVYDDREAFLDALRAYAAKIDERSERLLAMLRERPRTLDELAEARLLYPADHEEVWVLDAERRTIAQHLDELIGQDRVDADDEGRYHAR
ncbi:MAG: MBL fold metallo-hydrolase [Burkholderiaceae bacterium]|nr:MBL fold metallo-hydrolase [Burkholderiaceae bacterium]